MVVAARTGRRRLEPLANEGWGSEPWLLAGVVLIGAAARFSTLDQQSFWADEATTYGIVSHGLGHVLSSVPKSESTPPLFYVLLWLWSRVFGMHEVGLRSFSALCGTLTIPVMWQLGRRLVSPRVGLVAALLTAVSPLLFWYSQEARAYSLLVLASSLSLLALVWALESPTPRRLLLWGLACAVALNTHYFAAFVIASQAAWLAVTARRRGLATPARLTCATAPIVIAAAALLPLAIHQNDGRAGFIATDSGSLPFRLAQLVKQDVVAFDEPAKAITSTVAVLLVFAGLLLLVRRAGRHERAGALMAAAVGAGAVSLALIVALIATDYVNTRNLLETWPVFAVVAAVGFGSARAGRLGATTLAALVAVSVLCIVGVNSDARFQRLDWRGAARAMGRATVPRAIVGDHNAPAAFVPYLAGLSPFAAGTEVQEVDVFAFPYRRRGAHESLPPSRPAAPPSLPGFTVVARRETAGYTLLRYRAPAPVREDPATLSRLGLTPGGALAVLAQRRH